MKVVDIANEIYLENGSPTDTSIPSIAFWIRSNVGKLNTLLYEHFYVDTTTLDIYSPRCGGEEIGSLGSNIIKLMYKVYRLDLDIRETMMGIKFNSVIEAQDQDFSVKRINKSEVLKTLASLKKDTLKELTDQVHYYRSFKGKPSQVAGDDTMPGHYVQTSDGFSDPGFLRNEAD